MGFQVDWVRYTEQGLQFLKFMAQIRLAFFRALLSTGFIRCFGSFWSIAYTILNGDLKVIDFNRNV